MAKATVSPASPKKPGMSLSELNAKFNPNVIIPNKIRAALKQLGNAAAEQEQFRQLCGVSMKQLQDYAPQFEEYQVSVKDSGREKRLWCGTTKMAAEAREGARVMTRKLSVADIKSKYNPDQEVEHLRSEVAALQAQVKRERDATGEARLNAIALSEAIEAAKPAKLQYKPSNTAETPITYVLHLTDLHNGEVTRRDEVDGFGEFNPDIFDARLESLGRRVLDHVRIQRSGYNIPRLHILGTGDYVSGDIHHELQVTNAYPTAVQAVNCGYRLGALVEMLAPHFEGVTADMITLDNHGRMTTKNQAAQGGENNWGYVVAHILKQHVSKLAHVRVNIHAKPSALVPIGSERYLIFHGHQIKGWAGLPYYGFDRRVAMEAVKRMGMPEEQFSKLVFGHFHVAIDTLNYNAGGSLSGTNAFDHSCGRHARAHQTSWLVHDKHGQFGFTRWWL